MAKNVVFCLIKRRRGKDGLCQNKKVEMAKDNFSLYKSIKHHFIGIKTNWFGLVYKIHRTIR